MSQKWSDNHHTTPAALQYFIAAFISVLMVLLIALFTNSIAPKWDALYYVDMAKSGIINNPNLVAPYAYRPGMPLLSRLFSAILSISIEDGFRIVVWISAVSILLGIFTLARIFTTDYRQALLIMVILGFSFYHIKFPLFFFTLIDVAAYPFLVFSFWALITRRYFLCLVLSSMGIFFKEFLVIPLLLLFIQLGCRFWGSMSGSKLMQFFIAVVFGSCVIIIPRLCIPIQRTEQFVDPFNDPSTLNMLISAPLDRRRIFNILFSVVSYWLPTLLLITPSRLKVLRGNLKDLNLHFWCGIYLLLVLILTMYGGTNIAIFISYSVAVQVIVLSLLLRHNLVKPAEIIYVILIMVLYNNILFPIPDPNINLKKYIDFYGGWDSRVSARSIIRFIDCGVFIAFGILIRFVSSRISKCGT